MNLLPLHPQPHQDVYVSGDVTIHPNAAIAPGVLIQAEGNGRVVIGAGVCIGMGTVIHAHDGLLEIQSGAVLGAGVLLMGASSVGAGASIGSSSTIINTQIAGQTIVPPGSLLGDRSRPVSLEEVTKTTVVVEEVATEVSPVVEPEPTPSTPTTEQNGSGVVPITHVYGQAYVSQLLSTLLPHRQSTHSQDP
jgi:carbon dioxide concentrating mechanism protein CcmN